MKFAIWEATTGGNMPIGINEGFGRGIHNWLRIFGGLFIGEKFPKKDLLQQFDVILQPLLHESYLCPAYFQELFKGETKKPILIVIADPTPPTLIRWYLDSCPNLDAVNQVLSSLRLADYVMMLCENFIPYYTEADLIWRGQRIGPAIPKDKKWFYCPHPMPTLGMPPTLPLNQRKYVGIIRHVIWTNWFQMSLPAIQLLKIKMPDVKVRLLTAQREEHPLIDDYVPTHQSYEDYMKRIGECFVGLDNYVPSPQYGEFSRECAAVNVPCVGNKGNDIQTHVFPSLTVNDNDFEAMANLVEKLLNDKDFYFKMIKEGHENIQQYNYTACKKRMLDFLLSVEVDIDASNNNS